jgi:hypothetical protein
MLIGICNGVGDEQQNFGDWINVSHAEYRMNLRYFTTLPWFNPCTAPYSQYLESSSDIVRRKRRASGGKRRQAMRL